MSSEHSSNNRDSMSIPLAAMIDMVFLILVFFMCVSHLSETARGVEVVLPEAPAAKHEAEQTPSVTLVLDANLQLYIDGFTVTADELAGQLKAQLTIASGVPPRVDLRVHHDIPWQELQPIIVAITDAGASGFAVLSLNE